MKKTRYLYIRVIATPDFKKYYEKNWEKIIQKTIQGASEIYEKEFGIKIVPSTIEIKDINESRFYEIIDSFPQETPMPHKYGEALAIFFDEQVKTIQLKNYDLVLVFLGILPIFTDALTDAKQYIIISNQVRVLEHPEFILAHELGHCLGVKNHSKNPCSIMFSSFSDSEDICFDEKSKKIILKNKWKKFR